MRFGICTGECCEDFHTAGGLEEIVASDPEHAELLRWMLIRVGETVEGSTVWRCKLHDPKTGLCNAYELRPEMCRRYPNGVVCAWCGQGADSDRIVDPG